MLLTVALACAALVEAPVSLTTAEGVGLRMTAFKIDAVVAGPLAFTEMRLTFDNPEDRIIEGRFRLILPDGAAVSRFAMKIDDKWMEGEVVEKQAARRAYEDFLHRRQDPALLEQASPNEFTARVFPIPARGTKELIVSFSQEIAAKEFRVPLVGLPEIGTFSVRVRQEEKIVVNESKTRFVPNKDVAVALSPTKAMRSDDVLVARVVPIGASAPAPLGSTVILVDTSASRALGIQSDYALVRDVVAALPRDAPLIVIAFDQMRETIYDGTMGGFGAAFAKLRARRALGASDLGAALAYEIGRASCRERG